VETYLPGITMTHHTTLGYNAPNCYGLMGYHCQIPFIRFGLVLFQSPQETIVN